MAEEQGMCERGGSALPSELGSDRSQHLASSSDGPTSRLPQLCILELESKRTSHLGSHHPPTMTMYSSMKGSCAHVLTALTALSSHAGQVPRS